MLEKDEAKWGHKLDTFLKRVKKLGLSQGAFVSTAFDIWDDSQTNKDELRRVGIQPREALRDNVDYLSRWKKNRRALPTREEMLFLIWGFRVVFNEEKADAVINIKEAAAWMQLGGYGPLGHEASILLFNNPNIPSEPQFVEPSVAPQLDKTKSAEEEDNKEPIFIPSPNNHAPTTSQNSFKQRESNQPDLIHQSMDDNTAIDNNLRLAKLVSVCKDYPTVIMGLGSIIIVALFISSTFVRGCLEWDITDSLPYIFDKGIFVDYSDGNPFPDACGSQNVWYFFDGNALVYETNRYSELSGPDEASYELVGLLRWFVNSNQPHSGISINITDGDKKIGETIFPSRSVIVHPDNVIWIAIGWKSPINGYIAIEGDVKSIDPHGGDGIRWYIDHETTELASGSMKAGQEQNFLFEQENITVQVERDEFVYFRFHPKNNWNNDTSLININIIQVSPLQARIERIKKWF